MSSYTYVRIADVDFPNETMYPDWYKGQWEIRNLIITECQLNTITPNAFSASVFNQLQILEFQLLAQFEFNYNPSIGQELAAIYLTSIRFRQIANQLFTPVKKRIKTLCIGYMPDNVDFTTFFANERFSWLYILKINGIGRNATRSLDSFSLPRMPGVKVILLRKCGIATIHPKTFEYMGQTLQWLYLDENKLTTLSIGIFVSYIDVVVKNLFLLLTGNPFECTCEFYELRNYTIIGAGQAMRNMGTCRALPHQQSNCSHMQTISKEKLFIEDPVIYNYALPKMSIRIFNEQITISTTFNAKFRLFIVNRNVIRFRKNTKCPMSEWIRNSVKCIRITSSVKAIPIEGLMREQESAMITFGVILPMAFRRVWPLHIQTYRNSITNMQGLGLFNLCAMFSGSAIGGLLVSGLIIYCYDKWKTTAERKTWYVWYMKIDRSDFFVENKLTLF